jgi:acyl-CoA thioesterase-1
VPPPLNRFWLRAYASQSDWQLAGLAMIMRTILIALAMAVACGTEAALAAPIHIVVLGASNTYGKGVARGAAFPAQLQAMLKAKGYDVRVSNAGINGDTTAGMLRRLNSAVPAGTQIVILQPGNNDRRKGVGAERAGNISDITNRLQSRGIKVIVAERILAGLSQHLQPDGEHLTGTGYRVVAERLLPQVEAAIGRR